MKLILDECGYNNNLSILSLTEADIEKIESFINSKPSLLKKLKSYKAKEKFELKPGHRSTILILPKYYQEYINLSAQSDKNSSKQTSESQSSLKPTRKQKKKINKTVDELKNELINKLKHYVEKFNIVVEFSLNHIFEFNEENNHYKYKYKCRVKCALCQKKIVCNYSTHWVVSNLESHLKDHIKPIVQKSNENSSNNQSKIAESEILLNSPVETNSNLKQISDISGVQKIIHRTEPRLTEELNLILHRT